MTMTAYAPSMDRPIDRPIQIATDGVLIEADWSIPIDAYGAVILLGGSGTSRFNRRHRLVARQLYDQRYATLLVDVLTRDEEREDALTGSLRFDMNFLAERVIAAARWARNESCTPGLPLGYFATGTGAGAALLAAACAPGLVDAIVCRAGRPDLTGWALNKVKAPTLLIAGGADSQTVSLNRWAYWRMDCERRLEIVKTASNNFDDPRDLAKSTRLASEWFDVHLASRHVGWT